MLGWEIFINRQADNGASPATANSAIGKCLGAWRAPLGGLKWVDELVKEDKAIDLGGNGYPCRYTATLKHLMPYIVDGPPGSRKTREVQESRKAEITDCRPDEWLLIEAWDQS